MMDDVTEPVLNQTGIPVVHSTTPESVPVLTNEVLAGVIVGSVLAGLVLIGLLVVICFLCCQRRKNKEEIHVHGSPHTHFPSGANHQTRFHQREVAGSGSSSSHNSSGYSSEQISQSQTSKHKPNGSHPNTREVIYPPHNRGDIPTVLLRDGTQVHKGPLGPSSIAITSDDPPSQISSVTPVIMRKQVQGASGRSFERGLDNPAFVSENDLNESWPHLHVPSHLDPRTLSRDPRHPYSQVNISQRRKMDRQTAAAIAIQKDRNTSVYNVNDTESLINNDSVLVYDERTAL